MVDPIAATLLLGSFLAFVLLGAPVAIGMALSAVITTVYVGVPLIVAAQNMVSAVDSFTFLAVPFFIVAGQIMSSGGIANRLIKLSNAIIGWMRGGLAMVNILASMFFGGISGSALADTSSIGSILIPMMKKDGYDGDYATTVTMSSSIQGLLVPPSHNFIIYAMIAGGVSIARLFLAGLIPGVMLGIALMIYSYVVAVKRGYPVSQRFRIMAVVEATKQSFLGLMTILIIVFGVVTGVFTATESAAIAAVWAFVVTFFVYREIPLRAFGGILIKSLETLAVVMVLVASAGAFGWVIAFLRIPSALAAAILSLTTNPFLILLLVNILLLMLGSIMGMSSIIVILTPILLPIVTQIGMHPVHFGVVLILNLGIGLITPPVGGVLFVGSALSGLSIGKLSKSMLPFYAVMFAVLMLMTYVPGFVMFLPNLILP